MKRFISCITLSLTLAPASSAIAQWQFSADAGARYVRMAEIGADNRELVREYGWLPGIGLIAAYATQDWQFGLAGEFYRNDITYDGRLQNGAPFVSDTETTQRRIRLEAGKRITDAMQLTAAIEQDYWQRNILGRGSVAGMQEEYTSWRILAGAKYRMTQWSAGAVDVTGAVVFARPEKLRVRFDRQLYDDASLRTKSAVGFRLGLNFQPAKLPNLSLQTDFDWIRIGRSDNAVLRQNGVPVGFVTQSEHERTAFGLRANYRF
jgi:hypothetical protein